ncbi:MAG: hypothetical protein NVSMB52_07770 [Chloroflexota bacterium]
MHRFLLFFVVTSLSLSAAVHASLGTTYAYMPHVRAHAAKNMPYRGGAVMHQPTVYPIFWLPDGYHFHPDGSAHSDADYENLVTQFLNDLGGTSFYSLLTQYSDSKGPVSNTLDVGDAIVDTTPFPGNRGTIDHPLRDSEVRKEILNVIDQQQLDVNPSETLFLVYTPFDLQVCSNGNPAKHQAPVCTYRPGNKGRCGYHSYMTSHATRYLYGVVTNSDSFCHHWQTQITDDSAPNGDVYADIAVDVTSHELFEAVTDPFLNAWGANSSDEIGDKCSNLIGSVADDGSNVVLNGDPYIVQKEWNNSRGGCTL